MDRCKEILKEKVKEWPFYTLMFKSIFGNSFVQALIFILLGVIILFFAKGENKEIINTVGVTIISVSLFKFFLSANAFSKVISGIIKEAFLQMEFIQTYNNKKLSDILKIILSEILTRNYKNIKDSVQKSVLDILSEQNGYYSGITLEYSDQIEANGIVKSQQILYINNYSVTQEKYKAKTTIEKTALVEAEDMFKLEYVKINGEQIENVKQVTENKRENGTDFTSFAYEFDLPPGESKIEIKMDTKDPVYSHAFFIKKTSSNVKVIYKFGDTIMEPQIISKYGEEQLKKANFDSDKIEADFGDKTFFKSEFIYLKFKRKRHES